MNINEVVAGLREGHAFQRSVNAESERMAEEVSPAGFDQFCHSVSGSDSLGGSWGGVAILPIDTLLNGRFSADGWEQRVL